MAAAPQSPAQTADSMAAVTTTHLILMAVLAVVAILIIWWGSVLHRRRKRAASAVTEHFEAAEEHGATATPTASETGVPVVSADVPEPAEPAAPAASGLPAEAGDLAQIKGLGPKLVALLAERGITRVADLAALTPDRAAALDAELGTFRGRMARDRWIEQARLLAAGDRTGYEAAFGKLGV